MIAIHEATSGFSPKWVEYCENNNVAYKLVNCYDTDIIDQLSDCAALMWHWGQSDPKAANFARQLTYSLEKSGKKVFPNTNTVWHFDDKVGQKYLLESLKLELIPTYIFYEKKLALDWAKTTNYPKVFKLSRGAGSMNVVLVNNFKQAKKIISRCFGSGWRDRSRYYAISDRFWHFRRDRSIRSLLNIGRGILRFVYPHPLHRVPRFEHSYAYFQEFVPKNDHDIRVIVIGEKAFAIKRMVRDGDFRASGSGNVVYDPDQIPKECLKMAFKSASLLGSQCLAFDFVSIDGRPYIVEISYGFKREGYLDCKGYWNRDLEWHLGQFTPEWFMIDNILID